MPISTDEHGSRGQRARKFTNTRGGTELGVRLDGDAIDLSKADFDNQAGTVHLEGGLSLNYIKVRTKQDSSCVHRQGHCRSGCQDRHFPPALDTLLHLPAVAWDEAPLAPGRNAARWGQRPTGGAYAITLTLEAYEVHHLCLFNDY